MDPTNVIGYPLCDRADFGQNPTILIKIPQSHNHNWRRCSHGPQRWPFTFQPQCHVSVDDFKPSQRCWRLLDSPPIDIRESPLVSDWGGGLKDVSWWRAVSKPQYFTRIKEHKSPQWVWIPGCPGVFPEVDRWLGGMTWSGLIPPSLALRIGGIPPLVSD